jgi:DNA polymerase-3 subunit delta'
MIDTLTWLLPDYQKLSSLVKKHQNAHGILLIGPPGIGRRILAFELAGDFLKTDKFSIKTNQENQLDIFHPDCNLICPEENKTSISIDKIRSLKSSLELTSHQGNGKVGIIYPAESMTLSAANSLLKVLEEPPDETLLILITESAKKLPDTVVSRMQNHNVKKPSAEESIQWLNNYQTEENWKEIIDLFGSLPLLFTELGYEFLHEKINSTIKDINALILKKSKPSEIATIWAKEDLEIALKILYILISNLITRSLIKTEIDAKYIPKSLEQFIDAKLNYEECFNYLNEIANMRQHLLKGKGLNWNLQINNLLTPIYSELNGLMQHG